MAAMGRQVLHEDPKKALMDAFAIFDTGATGKVDASELRQVLGNLAERFVQTEGAVVAGGLSTFASRRIHAITRHAVEEMMRLSEQDADGKLQYKGWLVGWLADESVVDNHVALDLIEFAVKHK